jgi:signal transduction histidine kinase/CheY-like chemotaxis protein
MDQSQGHHADEFRIGMGSVILLQVIACLVYIVPIESDRVLSADIRLRYLEPILFLMPFVTVMVYRWRPWVGRWFAVLAPAVVIFVMQSWLPIPGSLALLAISTGLAAALIGPRAAAGVAAGSVMGLFVLAALSGAPDGWQIGVAFTAIVTTLVLTLSLHRSVVNVAAWSRNYYLEAVRIMQENRAGHGALQQALDDLAHANRQMTLLYERQTVLQRLAEEAEQTKSAFVAKVSHEFRTPLNMIIGLASVMIENPRMYGRALPADLLEDLRIIYRNCDHLASLVNDVLALSQLQSGNIVLHREELDLAATIEEALDVVRPLISQKKLNLRLEIPEQLGRVAADRTRIRQVILNLLSNAARFTDDGGISVCVCEQAREVVIAVGDSGPGIAPADIERIFEPFCQGSEQVWREKGGSGLGLTISKQFVELHGGRIWLESKVGTGTTFFVALPMLQPLPPARLPGSWISREWQWVERQQQMPLPRLPDRPRVVIYDPTQEIELGVSMYAGEVEIVASASPGEAIAEVQKTPAHAVLFGANRADRLLPLLQMAAQELPDTPLLGWTLPERMSPALHAGADQYLVKPISLASLRQQLEALAQPLQRILIADDDDGTRLLLTRMLLLHDSTVAVKAAANGAEALQLLQNEPFDLLLLDVMMPEVSGLQVLAWVRGDPRTRELPVIVISAQDLYESKPVCSEMMVLLGNGIQLPKALECAVGVAQILFSPIAESHPTLEGSPGAEPVWRENSLRRAPGPAPSRA